MGRLYIGNQKVAPLIYDKKEFPGPTREVDNQGVYGYPVQNFSFSLPSNATDIGNNILTHAFVSCSTLVSVDLSSLTAVSNGYAFDYAFQYCANLTSVDLSSLTTVSGTAAFQYAFQNCSSLTSVNLSSLTTVTGSSSFTNAFYSCTSLTSLSFPALTTLTGSSVFNNTFRYCTSLTSLSFPALTASSFGTRVSQFNNMLQGCSGVTVHFPAAIQSTIGSWASVNNGFGGTNTTVSFDL